MLKKTVICLFGPTASGKSTVAMHIADRLPIQLISVDSAMVYRGMDIGTAKPNKQELALYPHALIDILDPSEEYSVGRFCYDASVYIEQAWQANKIPLLVGGTMLYFYCLHNGLANLPHNKDIRATLVQRLHEEGLPSLYAELQRYDIESAHKIHNNDTQRILRALEVYLIAKQKLSVLQNNENKKNSNWKILNFALVPERKDLHQAIKNRWQVMYKMGFIDEVERFFTMPTMHANLPSMRALGYRQIWKYLAGEYSFITMEEKLLASTRQFAKRQCTWLNKWNDVVFLDVADPANSFLQKFYHMESKS